MNIHWTEEEATARNLEYGKWAELKMIVGYNLREAGKLAWTIVRDPRALVLVALGMSISLGVLPAEASTSVGRQGNAINISPNILTIDGDKSLTSPSVDSIHTIGLINDEQDQDSINAERITRIQYANALLEANPNLWSNAPEACKNSMSRIEIYGSEGSNNGGSAAVIESQSLFDNYGDNFMVHTLLVSDHAMRDANGNVLQGRVILFPGSYNQDQRFAFNTVNYTQIVGDDGTLLDEGILTVYGQGSWGDMREVGLVPLGIPNVRGISAVNDSGILHSFDYPGITHEPQFTTTQMGGTFSDSRGDLTQLLVPLPGSSTIWMGSSGAAICDPVGHHRGVVKNIPSMEASSFGIEGNPMTVQGQLLDAMFVAERKLEETFGPLH